MSAQTIDGVEFSGYNDEASLDDLYTVYQELMQVQGKSTTSRSNTKGAVYTPPSSDKPDDTTADEGSSVDINTLCEKDINSLNVGNTNAWVGSDANTWVSRNSHTHVCGTTPFVGDVLVTNTVPVQNDLIGEHSEETALHLEETIAQIEETQLHIEQTLLLHLEEHTGLHFESHAGMHHEIHNGVHLEEDNGLHTQPKK